MFCISDLIETDDQKSKSNKMPSRSIMAIIQIMLKLKILCYKFKLNILNIYTCIAQPYILEIMSSGTHHFFSFFVLQPDTPSQILLLYSIIW